MQKLGASFRDPSGFVFKSGDRLLRQVNKAYQENYDLLFQSGLYEVLVSKNLMVSHREVDDLAYPEEEGYRLIEPERIRYISYPYEWCFSQLKAAALITLEIQKLSLQHGMTLKDASAYNIQFRGFRPVFIDTLSFEKSTEKPWVAYRQFCQHFLAPLALISKTDRRLGQMLRNFIDGIPLDLAASLLPASTKLNPGLMMHLHLHAGSQKKYADKGRQAEVSDKISSITMSEFKAIAFIDQLTSTVRKLKWKLEDTEWGNYYSSTNYETEALREKAAIIRSYFENISECVSLFQDLGANDGKFAREISGRGDLVVCYDVDETAVEKNYLAASEAGDEKILPLVQDLTNPSPAIGWANKERDSLAQRGPMDVTMALALIHHLAISNNVPLEKIADYLASLTHYLIIEFVPKEDSQVRRLLATREDVFPDYDIVGFESAFGHCFNLLQKTPIPGTRRTLYLLENRNSDPIRTTT